MQTVSHQDYYHQLADEYFDRLMVIARLVGKYSYLAGETLWNPELTAMVDAVAAALPGGDERCD